MHTRLGESFFFFFFSHVPPFMKLLDVEHVHTHQVAWNPTIARFGS